MGLKKANYEIKELGLTLPTAYAIINRIEIVGSVGVAELFIQNSPRKNAIELKPLRRELVHFEVERNENPYLTAYKAAKGIFKEYNPQTGEFVEVQRENAPFKDWIDDIVVAEKTKGDDDILGL